MGECVVLVVSLGEGLLGVRPGEGIARGKGREREGGGAKGGQRGRTRAGWSGLFGGRQGAREERRGRLRWAERQSALGTAHRRLAMFIWAGAGDAIGRGGVELIGGDGRMET